jgi:hypothetical protein
MSAEWFSAVLPSAYRDLYGSCLVLLIAVLAVVLWKIKRDA